LDYIKRRQRQWEKKWSREAELEAKKEAERVAIMEAEARKQEEIAARKKLLLEQQEAERLRQKHIQAKEKLVEDKWNEQLEILLAQQAKTRAENNKLEEIRIIIQNREPSLQELGWTSWLSDPLNQELADLDYEHAMEMFKRDNLMAKRRHGTRGHGRYVNNILSFTGEKAADAAEDYVTTDFDPDAYELWKGFTVSYWVRPDEQTATSAAFGRRNGSSKERFFFGISNARTWIGVGHGVLNHSLAKHGMTIGEWNHFVVTYDGDRTAGGTDTRLVYLNGELHYPLTPPGNVRWNQHRGDYGGGGHNIYFGGRNNNGGYTHGWACGLSEVAIFNTVKDTDWIENVYNTNGLLRPRSRRGAQKKLDFRDQSGLVGYWKFNEGSGTTVTDYSGNGNHGTFAAISGDTTAYPTWDSTPFSNS